MQNRTPSTQSKAFRKILIVEPDTEVAATLKDILVEEGHSLHLTQSGEEAMEKIEAISPDLVLLDLVLPDIGGFEVCRMVRSSFTQYIPIIMIGHGKNFKLLAKGLLEGADDFIHKNFEREELIARVKVVLRHKEREETLDIAIKQLASEVASLQKEKEALEVVAKKYEESRRRPQNHIIHPPEYFQKRLVEEVSRIGRRGGTLACVRLALRASEKDARSIAKNLTKTHAVLTAVEKYLSSSLRKSDVATRFSPGEYAVLIGGEEKEQIQLLTNRLARDIRDLVRDPKQDLSIPPDSDFHLKVFVAQACYPEDTDDILDLGGFTERALKEQIERRRES